MNRGWVTNKIQPIALGLLTVALLGKQPNCNKNWYSRSNPASVCDVAGYTGIGVLYSDVVGCR